MTHAESKINPYLLLATTLGRRYLGCGGPTSRLEEKLSESGNHYGYRTEVFATPTGIFVSAIGPNGRYLATLLDRIRDGTVNLSELTQMDKILTRLSRGEIDLEPTLQDLKKPKASSYPLWLLMAAAFGVGALSSHVRFGDSPGILVSGLLTIVVYLITGPFLSKLNISGIFGDFLGSCIALVGAGMLSQSFDLPPEAFAIGSVSLLVPGLTITTAISELADQNFASGTIRLMKGALTFLAMATAYLLVKDLAVFLMDSSDIWYGKLHQGRSLGIIQALFENAGLILCFGIIFQVPRSALLLSTVTGMVGWIVLRECQLLSSFAIPPFMASTAVGLVSLTFSRFLNLPSQIYSVPGILSLLPGMLALSSFTAFGTAQTKSGPEVVFIVFIVACSIVFGLFFAMLLFSVFKNSFDIANAQFPKK